MIQTDTLYIHIKDKNRPLERELEEAAAIIRRGGLVAFPTETVYGLGADALNPDAAKKIYAAKGRPSDNPLIAHIADVEELYGLACEVPRQALLLADAFWPGPLTMILKKREEVPRETTGGLDTVAIRLPSDPVARMLIQLSERPIAAPSANISGRPSPTHFEHVREDMDGRIDVIIDGGDVGIGVESTIVDLTGDVPQLLRPGAITPEMLRRVLGQMTIDPVVEKKASGTLRPKAPGMKYRHYAPKAPLVIYKGDQDRVAEQIEAMAEADIAAGRKPGILCAQETRNRYRAGVIECPGAREDEESIAHGLFAALRDFDAADVDCIYSESFDGGKMGYAVMNRLLKAAGHRVEEV